MLTFIKIYWLSSKLCPQFVCRSWCGSSIVMKVKFEELEQLEYTYLRQFDVSILEESTVLVHSHANETIDKLQSNLLKSRLIQLKVPPELCTNFRLEVDFSNAPGRFSKNHTLASVLMHHTLDTIVDDSDDLRSSTTCDQSTKIRYIHFNLEEFKFAFHFELFSVFVRCLPFIPYEYYVFSSVWETMLFSSWIVFGFPQNLCYFQKLHSNIQRFSSICTDSFSSSKLNFVEFRVCVEQLCFQIVLFEKSVLSPPRSVTLTRMIMIIADLAKYVNIDILDRSH